MYEGCLFLHVNICQCIPHRVCEIHLHMNYQIQNNKCFQNAFELTQRRSWNSVETNSFEMLVFSLFTVARGIRMLFSIVNVFLWFNLGVKKTCGCDAGIRWSIQPGIYRRVDMIHWNLDWKEMKQTSSSTDLC